jgi:vacuolar-type H+-ATPase subunit E/Vma4
MEKHDREPIQHTCPDIDKVVSAIEKVNKWIYKLRGNEDEETLRDLLSDISNELWGMDTIMEKLRKSNDDLRQWGIEEAEYADRLQEKYENETSEV